MSDQCKLCGKDPADGHAYIDEDRYCHGDVPTKCTCYEVEVWERQSARHGPVVDLMASLEASWRTARSSDLDSER